MDSKRFDELFRLDGRVAVVTGGSRGIGLSIAETFALAGAKVVISSRKSEACDEAARGIRERGGEALAVAAHMGELDRLEALVSATLDRWGRLDIVVNNAANPLALPFGQVTPEAWQKSQDVNLRGPVFLMQYALPALTESPCAAIVNVASAGAYLFSAGTHMYAAAKAGLLAYTRALASELASREIRVNAIAPGTVDTDMVRNTPPAHQEVMARASLQGRAAHPDEVAGLALYLASDASSFVTGATVNVDGGLVPR